MDVKFDVVNYCVGIFEIFGRLNGGGHDRHLCHCANQIYVRTWPGGGFWGGYQGVNVADGQWHSYKVNVQTGLGQKVYIDGIHTSSHSYDHSNFNWKDSVRLGYSHDCGGNFQG